MLCITFPTPIAPLVKKVLIFTYYWPPAGGVSVQRMLKFVKYLPGHGWLPVVVTVKDGVYYALDPDLQHQVPSAVTVVRTRSFEPLQVYRLASGRKGQLVANIGTDKKKKSKITRLFEYVRANYLIPDARKFWKPFAVRAAESLLRQQPFDAMITTGPPHSTHLVGLHLHRRYGLPWLADFRDPWVDIFYNRFLPRTQRSKEKDRSLQQEVLASADCITVVGDGMRAKYRAEAKRVEVLPNGFDPDDFAAPQPRNGEHFIIRYIGSYLDTEHCATLWKALRDTARPGTVIEMVGSIQPGALESLNAETHDLPWTHIPQVTHSEALQRMQSAHLLLLLIPDVAHNHEILTGKLFEYIGSGTEILAIGPTQGDAARVLAQCGRKPMLDYEDTEGITRQLTEARSHPVNFRYNNPQNSPFDRRHQSARLASWLSDISAH